MADIFDQVAQESNAPTSGGDIFDQVAQESKPPAAPAAKPYDANPLTRLPAQSTADPFAAPDYLRSLEPQQTQTVGDKVLEVQQGPGLRLVNRATPTKAPASAQEQLDQQGAADRTGKTLEAVAPTPLSTGASRPQTVMADRNIADTLAFDPKSLDQAAADRLLPQEEQDRQFAESQGRAFDDSVEGSIANQVGDTAKQFGQGLKNVYDPTDAEVRESQGGAAMTPQERAAANAQSIKGLTQTIAAGGKVALVLDAPSLIGIGSAAASGDGLAQIALGKIATSFAAGDLASRGAGEVADHYNLTPEAKEFLQTTAFFLPSVLGVGMAKAGFKNAAGLDAEGNPAAGFSTPLKNDPITGKPIPGSGAVVAGVRATPDAYEGAVSIGGKRVSVTIPRTPPTPATVTAQGLLDSGLKAMSDANAAAAAAKDIVAGADPAKAMQEQKPQPPDFTPADMKEGHLSPQTVAQISQAIRIMPQADRSQAIMEAHGKLADWMAQTGKFVGPDGQIQIVKNPDQAQQLAAKLINEQVAKHDEAAAAQQQQTAPEAQPTKGGTSKLQKGADDALYQRAKTLIEANPDRPNPVSLLQRNLQIGYGKAQELIDRHKADSVATVGSAGERVVPETPATIDAQMDALRAGTIKAVMLPEGSSYEPKLEAGMKKVVVSGDAPGAGTYIIKGISPDTVKEAAKAGTHGDLLGHVQTKEDIAAGGASVAVVASKPDGTEIQASEVNNPQAAQAQAESLAERHPGAKIEIKPIDDVVKQRMGEETRESGISEGKGGRGESPEPERAGVVAPAPLPKELAGSKPRYGYKDKNFELDFADPRDKAAYTLTQGTKNKRHDDFLNYWKEQNPGKDETYLERHASDVRDYIKDVAKLSDPKEGPIKVPNIADTIDRDQSEWPANSFADIPSGAADKLKDIFDEVATEEKPGEPVKPAKKDDSEAWEAGEQIKGVDGKQTTVKTPSGNHAGRYRLVDLHDLIPSHDPLTFKPHPDYPVGVQERNYESPEAKHRVISQGQNLDPDYLVNTNPDAVNGPPIITPDGVVLGGNSRTMSIARAFHGDPKSSGWQEYRDALKEHAETFGITAKDVAKNLRAVLVREIEQPKTLEDMERVGSALNKTMMGSLSPNEKAVSAGRKINLETMDEISRLIDASGTSIRDMLRESGPDALELLVKSGALTEREAQGFRDGRGLSEAGKDFIEKALLGKVVDDSKLMDATPKSILNKLDGALAAIVHIDAEADEYNLLPVLRDALHQHAEIAERKLDVETFQNQTGVFDQRNINPVVDALAKVLAEKPTDVKKAFRNFAADAKESRLGQGNLLGGGGAAFEAFNANFGATLTDEEYRHGLAQGVSEEEPRAAASIAERGDSGVQDSGSGKPEAGGKREADRGDGGQSEPEHKYKFGNVQHNLDDASPAAKALDAMRSKVANADLAGEGRDVGENHVTVRYGLRKLATPELKAFLRAQAPFEAKLGKVAAFPPHADAQEADAAPLIAHVEAPELHSINAEIDKHDDFEPSRFPDYKPHATVAYVKPDAVKKYVGNTITEGKTFMVRSIAVGDRDGNHEEIPLEGKKDAFSPKKEDRVRYTTKDGKERTGRFKAEFGPNSVRIAPDGGGKPDVIARKNILGPAPEDSKTTQIEKMGYVTDGRKKDDFAIGDIIGQRDLDGNTSLELSLQSGENPFTVRYIDNDSGEVISIRRFGSILQAGDYYKKFGDKVQSLAEPAKAAANESLSDHFFGQIEAGKMPSNNIMLRKMVEKFDGKPASDSRMKEAQEALEAAIVRRAREIMKGNESTSDRLTYRRMLDLYESQPLLNVRTTTSIENQAYSTPAPLAFLASELAGITKESKVYEPTAGNGMLTIGATPKNVQANELNPDRAAALREQGLRVTEGDALKADIKPKSVDAVITNPPFGSVKGSNGKPVKVDVDGYKVGQIDHLIAARALDAMKDDGKATIILGANKVAGGVSTDDRIFFNWLYSHYNVTSHFEIDGKLYNRQGAAWPVRVINVDGRVRSDKFSPAVGDIQRVSTWKDVYDKYRDGLAAQEQRDTPAGNGSSLSRPEDEPARVSKPSGESAGKPDRSGPLGSKAGVDRLPRAEPQPLPGSDVESAAGLAATDSDVRPDADASRSDRLAEGQPRTPSPKRTSKPSGTGGSDLTDADNAFQVGYRPASSKKDQGVLIPTNMRDPLEHAMAALSDRVGDIDEYVAEQLGYGDIDKLHDALMGLQVDSVAAAIDQINQGKAVIIADQTGIGKGRQAAAINRWAIRHGHIPIFMSMKATLFTDMYGDLADIGTTDLVPFIVNVDESISLPNGTQVFGNKPAQHRAMLEKITDSGELPEGRNALFLTYSQINMEKVQRDVLRSLAPKAIFILDESHNAAGESATGDFMQEVLALSKGVTYLSATYAKRPDNMALYSKTDIGTAISDKSKLEDAMAMGGLPLQTVVANNLVKAGQMFRRERSYDGVEIKTLVDTPRKQEHIELADKVTEALRAITKADRMFHREFVPKMQKQAEGEAISGGGNKADISVGHTEFSSVVHNFVRQMLLALKADNAASEAIERIKKGEKPIIAVELTNGSFLSEYASNNNIKDGQPLGDFSYRTVLHRALDRSRVVKKKNKQGVEITIPIHLNQLDEETLAEYRKAQTIIDALKMDLPMSPIDWMRDRITKAGYKVAEITGRDLAVDYTNPKQPTLSSVPAEELSNSGKVETTRRFNDGRIDAIILNVSGSTGISLHASEKFKDQRKRHMIVAQPAQDINIFMQMLGRIHRTGQVQLPGYSIMAADLPAEKRPTALLSKKMKSLNANTSSNTESATSVQASDILNKYGDEIVGNYLDENDGLAFDLNVKPMEGDKPAVDIARLATGRLAIMPVAVQEAFYRDVEQQYADYIDYLNSTNQNDLEPRTYDFEAKELKTAILSKGENPSSPFGADSIYGEYSIKAQSKPLTAEDVTAMVEKSLAGLKPREHAQKLIDGLNTMYGKWIATLDLDSPTRMSASIVRNIATNFIQGHQIGSTMRLEVNGDAFTAAVVNIESSHKGNGNAFSLSKINVTLATTGPQPNIKIPAKKLIRITLARLHDSPAQIFQLHRPPAREVAKIVTGNLLAAYGEMKDSKGTIINFTKADGSVEQGILLPKKFNLKENTMGDYRMRSPDQIVRFLRTSKDKAVSEIGVASRDGDVRAIRGSGGEIILSTPKSKARGGKYFLDRNLTGITGDWVSRGPSMRVALTAKNESAALEALMKKTALYVPKSLAAEAEGMEKIQGKPPASGGPALRSSLFGVDILAGYVKTLWDADVAPHIPDLGKNIAEATATVTHALMPTAGVNRDILDSFSKLKGEQERALYHVDQLFHGIEDMFGKLSVEQRIDFLDKYKRGEEQATPELDKVAGMYRTLDTATYKRIIDAQVGALDKPARRIWDRLSAEERDNFFEEMMSSRTFEQPGDGEAAKEGDKDARKRIVLQRIADSTLSFKENHLRAFWKVIPGSLTEKSTNRGRRSPLRGDRGFTKRSTLPDVSTGLADGGVLESDNPQRLVEMGQKSALRYVTALNMFKEAGDLGRRVFVPLGQRAPEGWEEINDGMFNVYRPITELKDKLASLPDVLQKEELNTRSSVVQSGKWYMPQGDARLLNNYLSKDWFRTNALGRGLMKFKMVTTGIELGLSPFHLVFEGIEAIGSQFGLGLMNSWNKGVRYGDGSAFLDGLKLMATSPAAPVTMARTGGKAIQAEREGWEAFASDPANKGFLKAFPNAPHLIDLAFRGGLTMAMPREYRVELMKSATQSLRDGNPLGALARAVPGIAQTIMKPLFEVYIPRIKLGFTLRALAQQLAEQHDAIVRGDVTEGQVARDVVNSTENRFGELNFSNLWWDNTFKGVNQLLFRSVTWKLGNWRGATTGVGGQAKAFSDPIKTMYDDARGYRKGDGRSAHEYIPKLDLNMSWLIGMAVTTAALGTIISKLETGKYPWEFLEEDEKRGMSMVGALALEMIHPRTGGTDSFTGHPTRISLPTGARDFEHAAADPRGYLHGSLSGFVGKTWDTWDNKDFFGNYVYDPNGTTYRKLADIISYNAPLPITMQQILQGKKTGDFSQSKLGLLGLSKAANTLDMTSLEKHLDEIAKSKHMAQTPEEREEYQEKTQAIREGTIKGKERTEALKRYKKPYLERMFDKLSYTEAKNAYFNFASPDEQHFLKPMLATKRKNALRRNPQAGKDSSNSAN